MRILVGVMISVALVSCGVPVAIDRSHAPIPDGPISFEGVTLVDDGRSVRVDFIGGPEFDPNDPCSIAYEGTAEVVGEELRIGIFAIQHPMPLPPEQGCASMGYSRSIVLSLSEPFEGSVIRDLAGGVLFLEAPPGLATIGELPDGWELRREGNILGGTAPRWERVWSPDPDPSPAQGDSMLILIQAFGGPVEATGSEPQRAVLVNGRDAAYWMHPATGEMLLVWSLGDDELALVGYLEDFTEAEFIGLAGSVAFVAGPSTAPSATPEPSPRAIQADACEHESGAYRVRVPAGWWTNPAFEDEELGTVSACRSSDPRTST